MLLLLVPGVGMGATATGGPGGSAPPLLMLMGVGRSWLLPLLVSLLGAAHGR